MPWKVRFLTIGLCPSLWRASALNRSGPSITPENHCVVHGARLKGCEEFIGVIWEGKERCL